MLIISRLRYRRHMGLCKAFFLQRLLQGYLAVCVGLFLFLCVGVVGCVGTTSWVVLRGVFECWLVFLGAFGSGRRCFVLLVFMARCCFVVGVGACWVSGEFHWLMSRGCFFCRGSWNISYAAVHCFFTER